MSDRYPGYDVLDRRWTESWNRKTREVVDRRLTVHPGPRFFDEAEWRTLKALCARILPQDANRPQVPLAAYVDEKMHDRIGDGYRYVPLPSEGEAWRRGLAGIEAAAQASTKVSFHALPGSKQDEILTRCASGDLKDGPFADMPCKLFFSARAIPDITSAYYAHPFSWNEIGFGGPASPRGYVRMELNDRDPWEPMEEHGDTAKARRENVRVR